MNHDEVKSRLLADPLTREAYDHPPLALLVADTVVSYRRTLGLTQEQLAELLGASQNQVYRIESGAPASLKTLEKVIEVLGLRVSIEPPQQPTPLVSSKLHRQPR